MIRYLRVLGCILLLLPASVSASHMMGGSLSYHWLSGNTYEIKFTFYRDCVGILPSTPTVQYHSSCNSGTFGVALNLNAGYPQQISPVCPGVVTTCNGGSLTGVQKYVYSGQITLPVACNDWVFSILDCCRNVAITNLQTVQAAAIYTAMLNNFDVPFNNSVLYAIDPVIFLNIGYTNHINNGAFDPDGDSIVVSLDTAMTDSIGSSPYPIPYDTGFSALNPISSSPPMIIDPSTGDIQVTPTASEVDVVVYLVEEYRNGILVGSSSRDIQVSISPGSNLLPFLTGINGSNSFITSVCAGDTLHFTVQSDDLNSTDTTTISVSGQLAPLVTYTINGGQHSTASVEFITDSTMINPQGYILNMTVRDDHCPFRGSQSYAYQIYVNGCSGNVWPGDANDDLDCNLYDVLPIGLGYNANGPIRNNASLLWVPQVANDWSQTFLSNVNYKFADCNGDGQIDYNDTTAIGLNYGMNHPARLSPPVHIDTQVGLYASPDVISAGPNDLVHFDIYLRYFSGGIPDCYGIAFKLGFDPTVADLLQSQFSFVNGSLGTPGNDLLPFVHPNWGGGIIDAAAVRNDHVAVTSDSIIASFDLKIASFIPVNTVCNINLTGIQAVDALGNVQYYSDAHSTINITASSVGIPNAADLSPVKLFPNPVQDILQIKSEIEISTIRIWDAVGRIVYELSPVNSKTYTLATNKWENGVYSVEINMAGGKRIQRFTIAR